MKTISVTLKQGGWLPPGSSPYWANHKEDWNKLRAYREALKTDSKAKSVSVKIDLEEWAKALDLDSENLDKLFFRRLSGFKKADDFVPQAKKISEEIEK